ncbi:MAG: hypothetical protein H6Q69_302 [Firmicutes bacterium]|nr:hypothetical protein [Bacillota bacterium]
MRNAFNKGFAYAEKYHKESLAKKSDAEIQSMINKYMREYRENGDYYAAGMAGYYQEYLKRRKAAV